MGKINDDIVFGKNKGGLPAKLNLRQLRQLLDNCMDNAKELIRAAEILCNHKLYSPSVHLSVLALEELGKRRMLPTYIWVGDIDSERKRFWNDFRSHKRKLYLAFWYPFDIDKGAGHKVDYISLFFERDTELRLHSHIVDKVKQLTLYTDVVEGVVTNPKMFFNKQSASDWLAISKQCLDYQTEFESADNILQSCKSIRKRRKKGESAADFLGRLLMEKAKRRRLKDYFRSPS